MSKSYRVSALGLNVRRLPQLGDNVVGVLHLNRVFDSESESTDGHWVSVPAKVWGGDLILGRQAPPGWVSKKYLVALNDSDAEFDPPWLVVARAQLGVEETPGPGDNPRVVAYLKSTTLPRDLAEQDETPWCAAFVNWCLEAAGYAAADSARARDWLSWGRAVSPPRLGAVTVFSRDGGGHAAFFIRQDGSSIYVLGGNQSDRVSIAPYPLSRLLGYRMPSQTW